MASVWASFKRWGNGFLSPPPHPKNERKSLFKEILWEPSGLIREIRNYILQAVRITNKLEGRVFFSLSWTIDLFDGTVSSELASVQLGIFQPLEGQMIYIQWTYRGLQDAQTSSWPFSSSEQRWFVGTKYCNYRVKMWPPLEFLTYPTRCSWLVLQT